MFPERLNLRGGRWRQSLLAGAVATVLAAAGMAAAATGAQAAAGCRVTYTSPGQWPGGFTGNVSVTNLGAPVSAWQLVWSFTAGQTVTQAWNASVTMSGSQATAVNMSYNGALGTNATVSFGFNGTWTGSNPAPASFSLNGVTCTGSVVTPSPTASATASPTPSTSTSPVPGNPQQIVAAMQPGWNLGNTFDATGDGETSWGNPRVTEALLENIKAQGFKSIRIPVTWGQYQGQAPGYTINATYLNRVKEVVDWALADGFYVMINIHHDSWQWVNTMPAQRSTVLARYSAIWTQVSSAFRDTSAKLVFESINEPQFTGSSGDAQSASLLHELNTVFRDIVRQSGGGNANRLLILPTLHTSADQPRLDELASTINVMGDPNVVATVHFYGYWPFSVNVAGGTRFDATVQNDLTGVFDRVHSAFVSRGIPVIIGEYGLLGFDRHTGTIQQGEKLKFFEFLGHYARAKQITTMLWDNGQHFNRNTHQWTDPELFGQIKSSWTTRSGTASADQIYVPRSSAITAKSLTLNLNGTSFQGLRQGSADLVNGSDYTVQNGQLTLTAATVTRLAGARAYGVNATLSARFSQGVPWRIDIVTYDPPVLQNATGTTSSLVIPVTFRGDQLATMEAKYPDGSNAGPHNWTSFKEFDRAFAPNYAAGTITLPAEFFAEVNDNSTVNLTFHFWSGTTVRYNLTRSGSAITGTIA